MSRAFSFDVLSSSWLFPMADLRWNARLRPVQHKVVPLINGLLSGLLLDALLAKNLLSDEDYESVRTMRRQNSAEAAKDLISLLKKKAPPAFDTFCQTLRDIDGGDAILNELQVATSSCSKSVTFQPPSARLSSFSRRFSTRCCDQCKDNLNIC